MITTNKTKTTWKFDSRKAFLTEDQQNIITEASIKLAVNGEEWLTFICSPVELDALALGFLWNEGIINDLDEVQQMVIRDDLVEAQLTTPAKIPTCWHRTSTGITLKNKHASPVIDLGPRMTPIQIIRLFEEFSSRQDLYQSVGGYHSAAISDGQEINISVEDVGRHNCLDKIAGIYLRAGKQFTPRLVLLTGRVSSEMIHKALRLGVPFIVSRTTPTSNAVEIAEMHGICLIGYLRGNNFTVFSHPEYLIIQRENREGKE